MESLFKHTYIKIKTILIGEGLNKNIDKITKHVSQHIESMNHIYEKMEIFLNYFLKKGDFTDFKNIFI